MKSIKEILANYDKEDYQIFKDTVDQLCSKGIAKGCFQDYTVLTDVISILAVCETMIKEGEK